MITRLLFLVICLLGLSCGNKLMEEPDNLISREKMTDILYDMALLNAIDNSHPQVLEENDLEKALPEYRQYQRDVPMFVPAIGRKAAVAVAPADMVKETCTGDTPNSFWRTGRMGWVI